MPTLTCMRGYPGSGKTTIARTLPGVRVCRDDLRKMLHDSYWTGDPWREEEVTIAERAQVRALLKAGLDVVVDSTHLNSQYLKYWAKAASECGADFKVVDVKTSPGMCIDLDHARGEAGERSVGADVIMRAAKHFPMDKWPEITAPEPIVVEPVEWVHGLREAIIVDIDGTLAHMTGRSPYDYSQVHTDTVDEQIRWLVNLADDHGLARYGSPGGVHILVVSGRDDTCREATRKWLFDNDIPCDSLHMRPADARDLNGNKLPDWQVKLDIFNKHIRGKYNVWFVLDDRNQVVDMWRALGLKCLQVQPGDF